MLRSSLLLTLVLLLAGIRAEYVWTGTEWKWNEPGSNQQGSEDTISVDSSDSDNEGSGSDSSYGDDEDDYDDNYNYNEVDDTGKYDSFDVGKSNIHNTGNTGILPATDDEDMLEGSGGSSNVGSGYDDYNRYSGNNNRNKAVVTEPPYKEPEVYMEEDDEDYTYDDEDDYEDYSEEEDDINFGDDTDSFNVHNVDVQVTAKPTPYANPFPTQAPTTRKPTYSYTDAPEVHKERPSNRPASFFAQPGILAAVIGGAVVGLLCAILLVMFIVYRMRKKDEGSYALDEPKRSHNVNSYSKPPSREFYA